MPVEKQDQGNDGANQKLNSFSFSANHERMEFMK